MSDRMTAIEHGEVRTQDLPDPERKGTAGPLYLTAVEGGREGARVLLTQPGGFAVEIVAVNGGLRLQKAGSDQ
jgi:hypothetical protein